jgi:uncharacterized protein (DUF1697 family)
MNTYTAFLRGINVGGRTVSMQKLKKTFEALRFKNVRTLLASGNVVFETSSTREAVLEQKIEDKLKNTFGFEIEVLVRTIEELRRLIESNPFIGVKVTQQTRLYITFLSEKPKSKLHIPYKSQDGNFKIVRASEREVCSVATPSPDSRTVDLMSILEKEFGKEITTRNSNTIEKILKTQT